MYDHLRDVIYQQQQQIVIRLWLLAELQVDEDIFKAWAFKAWAADLVDRTRFFMCCQTRCIPPSLPALYAAASLHVVHVTYPLPLPP